MTIGMEDYASYISGKTVHCVRHVDVFAAEFPSIRLPILTTRKPHARLLGDIALVLRELPFKLQSGAALPPLKVDGHPSLTLIDGTQRTTVSTLIFGGSSRCSDAFFDGTHPRLRERFSVTGIDNISVTIRDEHCQIG